MFFLIKVHIYKPIEGNVPTFLVLWIAVRPFFLIFLKFRILLIMVFHKHNYNNKPITSVPISLFQQSQHPFYWPPPTQLCVSYFFLALYLDLRNFLSGYLFYGFGTHSVILELFLAVLSGPYGCQIEPSSTLSKANSLYYTILCMFKSKYEIDFTT